MKELVNCVSDFRKTQNAELEIRLGSAVEGSFCPGISKHVFVQLEQDLVETSLDRETKWSEIVDYYFLNRKGETVRTRVEYDSDKMEVNKTHICKQTKQSFLFFRTEGDTDDEVCKLALSTETPVVDLPVSCMPTHIRIKQRRCFRDIRLGKVVWSYELCRTWSGATRTAVEQLQLSSEPMYEVEVELVDEDNVYSSTRTNEEIASSLQLKIGMLLGETGTSLRLLSCQQHKRRR